MGQEKHLSTLLEHDFSTLSDILDLKSQEIEEIEDPKLKNAVQEILAVNKSKMVKQYATGSIGSWLQEKGFSTVEVSIMFQPIMFNSHLFSGHGCLCASLSPLRRFSVISFTQTKHKKPFTFESKTYGEWV